MIDVVTMRFGDKYGPEYVNRLFRGVTRHCSAPFRFWCFTDDASAYEKGIHVIVAKDLGGWWNHLYAFSGWTEERQLLIDVDDVVVGSLDDLAGYEGPHALNSDVYRPQNVDGGCQVIPREANRVLYDEFMQAPKAIKARYCSDKEYYIDRINDAPRLEALFPFQWVSYKVHCGAGLPPNARIVGFHGEPKPADLPVDHQIRKIWESN